jgi:osmotically-inducible protein OsmY
VARNAKVITANGVVLLRGPVKSDAERDSLEAKARKLAGTNRVENHLDVVAAN